MSPRDQAPPLTTDNPVIRASFRHALSTGTPVGPAEIYNRLLNDRIVFLGTEVDDEIANILCAQMLFSKDKIAKRTYGYTSIAQVVL